MSRQLAIAAAPVAGFLLLGAMFYVDAGQGEPDGLTARQRLQCEQIIKLTRDEMNILGEKLGVLQQLITEDADNATKQQWKTELLEVQTRLDRSMAAVTELEKAIADGSLEAIEAMLNELKSR